MVRRFANQVHQQVSRLMRANYIKKEPAWYQAVLQYPPLPLPPRAPPSRTEYDHSSQEPELQDGQPVKLSKPKTRPLAIQYMEDQIRRQFFRDHPFEAFRPNTLVEGARIEPPHALRGQAWKRLRQRGRNPSPEDAIEFAVNLRQSALEREKERQEKAERERAKREKDKGEKDKGEKDKGEKDKGGKDKEEGDEKITISQAYLQAVAQFRALRSEHHIASTFAVLEAEALGYSFEETEVEKLHAKHLKELEKWGREEEFDDESTNAAKKRWRAIVETNLEKAEWSKGEAYVKLWKDNAKAEYAPALTQPILQTPGADPIENAATTSAHPIENQITTS